MHEPSPKWDELMDRDSLNGQDNACVVTMDQHGPEHTAGLFTLEGDTQLVLSV